MIIQMVLNLPRYLLHHLGRACAAKQIEPYLNRRLENGLHFKKISEFIFWCIREKLYELEKKAGDTESVGGQLTASDYITPRTRKKRKKKNKLNPYYREIIRKMRSADLSLGEIQGYLSRVYNLDIARSTVLYAVNSEYKQKALKRSQKNYDKKRKKYEG